MNDVARPKPRAQASEEERNHGDASNTAKGKVPERVRERGRGGGCRAAASLLSFRAAACGTPFWPSPCRWRAHFRRARAVGAEVPPRAGGG